MLLRRLKLVNYGGIYNGLGLYEIEIDFTRCTHNIILIKGDNGSGKSTIESALKPLPDDNTAFIANMNARKEIEYLDEQENVIYSITFLHEISGSSRKSRGYISKGFSPVTMVELNPSGNISSCKDIIYEEFQLDPNFISLSQLSATKRGIADLKPGDRKRYVNSILTNTNIYNEMYKTLSKKASNYKAMVQSAATKLDNIGNLEQIELKIQTIDSRIKEAEDMLEKHYEILNKEKGMLEITDPDNKIRERIDNLLNALKSYNSDKARVEKELESLYNADPALRNMVISESDILAIGKDMIQITNDYNILQGKISLILESRKADSEELQVKTAKLSSINSGSSLSEARRVKSELKYKKETIERRWNGVVDVNSITSEEFKIIYDVICELNELAHTADIYTGDITIEHANTINRINDISDMIDKLIDDNNRIAYTEDKAAILNERPKDCIDDTCPFIVDALKAQATLEQLLKCRSTMKTIGELNREKESYQDYLTQLEYSSQFKNLYIANQRILRLLNFGFDSLDSCVRNIKSNGISILTTMSNMLEYLNDVDEYRVILSSMSDIEKKYNELASQEDYINMLISDIDKLQKQVDKDNEDIETYNATIDNMNSRYNELASIHSKYSSILANRTELIDIKEKIEILNDEIQKNRNEIKKILDINNDIEKLNVNISDIKTQLEPLQKEKAALEYKYTLSKEYTKELNECNILYKKIDTLKYYCSPTKGIQLVFAEMYLSKIISEANRILMGLFGGSFALMPLIISENEFRIPVAVNGGINHDDITSMSSAQISLISMIISIALLSQTSTKLNIIVGDEIDAPFDGTNRRVFTDILHQLMSLVKSSQCVLISHNSEIDMSDCDIILLKSDNDIISNGNIIWSYR